MKTGHKEWHEKGHNKWHKAWCKKAAIIAFWLVVWQLLALFVGNELLVVTPGAMLRALWENFGKTEFWMAVAGSMGRIALGFLAGVALSVCMAGAALSVPRIEEFLSPAITLAKSVPVATFAVLLLIWWGSDGLTTAISFLVTLPILYLNLLQGLKNTDGKLLEMAAVFKMPLKNRFFYLYRPAVRPFAESSIKLALGMCWKSGVAAEIIGTPAHSIGERMYLAKIYMDTAGVFAWTGVILCISILFEKGILFLVKRFFEWQPVWTGTVTKKSPSEGKISGDEVLLRCDGIRKSYHGDLIIQNYTRDFKRGEKVLFTSPSGSGKTTLFRILCGLEKADGGTISKPKVSFSFCFQEDRLCEEYSAIQNVAMVTGDPDRAERVLSSLLPENVLRLPCSSLSGGMKRKVAVVRAMEAESDCVILDEPYTGQDGRSRQETKEYIEARQKGRLLLIATHLESE